MGRGRQKAKQTKVARDLKYRTIDTDFASLERELRSESASSPSRFDEPDYDALAEQYGAIVEDDDLGYDEDERRSS